MSEHISTEGTPEYVDYLLDSYAAEIRLSERYDLRLGSIAFYRDLLRAAYLQMRERTEQEAERKVVIEVLGGVAYVTCCPDVIDVEIIDHDNEATAAFDPFREQADMPQAGDARDDA